ncbi:SGNH hydrolase-type esterase domain-containing protein [Rhexocercosporidium sp. MPI-PUGE-AT-0058]|nr:SGNH hydrolase-type esterase domain-containing protein [Rhexocercosporidium sp. MPI-PUGE-AT-0058]
MMVVGDSISHGAEGDWTWRWRLADWLSSQGHKITWVGPYSGTHGPQSARQARPRPPRFPGEAETTYPDIVGLYADGVPGSFAATGHASYWGRQAVQTRETIKDWVSTYQPDYILILLGFNDLGWLFTSPGGLVGVMGDLVGNARQGNPNVKILFGNVVQRSFIGGRQDLVDNTLEYNKLLKTELSQWFRYESPITYVDVATIYRCFPSICPDGYDGLHPDAHGEFSIAIAFANALKVDWHFPGDAMQFGTIPDRPISTPNNVVAAAVPEGIYLAWELVENARGYEFRARIKGLDIWWSDGGSSTFVVWYTWVYPDQEWEFQVRTKVTDSIFSAWSGLVSTVAHPSTAPGPSNIHVTPVGGNSFAISWDAVSGYSINRYEVIVWDQDIPGAWTGGYAAAGTSTTIGGLLNGHRYAIWVATWVNLDGGPAGGVPAGARQVTIGAGTPAAPSGFSASNVDPTTAHLTWSSSSGATGYAIYGRALPSGKFTLSGTTTLTSQDVGWLYPGTWNYEFCIAAYNGNLESDHLSCATPPVAPGWSKRTRSELPADASNITFISNTTAPVNGTNMADHVQLQSLWSAMQATRAAADAGLGSNSSISTR